MTFPEPSRLIASASALMNGQRVLAERAMEAGKRQTVLTARHSTLLERQRALAARQGVLAEDARRAAALIRDCRIKLTLLSAGNLRHGGNGAE